MRPMRRAPPFGKRSEAAASIVGHMKQTPAPQIVAARSPVTGEFALLRSTRPPEARRQEHQSSPTGESRCASGPAKWRITNIRPLT
jgi:hypothetical protein